MAKGVIGHQLFLRQGAQFWFKRNPTTSQDIVNFGVIGDIAPAFDPQKLEVFDAHGVVRKVFSDTYAINETYAVKVSNMNDHNIAVAWGADLPESYTQAASAVLNSEHTATAGQTFKLQDTAGEDVFMLTSIQGITLNTSGGATLVADSDYEIADADYGIIRLLAGGDNALVAGTEYDLLVDYTPAAITGDRLWYPQNLPSLQGTGYVCFAGNANEQKYVRKADVTIALGSPEIPATDVSKLNLVIEVTSDLTSTTAPAGTMKHIKGTLPSVS